MKKTIIIAVLAFGMNVTAQTLVTPNNIVKATNGSLLLQGTNASGVATQSVAISNVGHISGRSMDLNGADGLSVQKITNSGTTVTGAGGTSLGLKVNGYAEVTQNLYVNGATFSNQIVATSGNFNFSGAVVGGIRADYSNGNSAVNVNQLFAVRDNLRGESNQVQNNLNKTNQNVAANTNAINNLQNTKADKTFVTSEVARLETIIDTKADKVQVAQDIQHARQQAIRISNEYTDEKISEVNYKVNTEVKRLDDKLDLEIEANRLAQKRLDDKINLNDEKINQRVKDLEIKIDNRFNAVMSYVGNEFAAVNNRIEGLGASMVALSAAATSSVYNANKPTNLNIATGLYGRATAIAVGMSHFFNSSTKVSVNWSQGSNTKNAVGIGCGIAF